MLSRVAENLYWMTRYMERAENTARFINSTTQMLLDLPHGASFGWDVLLEIAGLQTLYKEYYVTANEGDIMRFLILDERNPSSIVASIHNARENTRTFREVLPMEIWERINGLYLYTRDNAARATHGRSQRYEVLNGVIERRQSVVGLLLGSMSHDLAYQFITLGRNIERADMTTRIVDVNSAVRLPEDAAAANTVRERFWMSTLNALSAYQTYRQHVGVHIQGTAVANFLLRDPDFPRTVVHCLNDIQKCLDALENAQEPTRVVQHILQRLGNDQIEDVSPLSLHLHIDRIQLDLGELHNAIARQYFLFHHAARTQSQSTTQ